jgi:NAD(P)-dependent dehydrogenase (short-subunit alcohol dehydrogenase family)
MPNAYDLAGKTAVVTGGAKGIGRAIAARLLTSGAQVWIWDAKPVALQGAKAVALDVTSSEQVSHALEQLVASGSRIDILVNNAGYLGAFHVFEDHNPTDWLRIIQVNLIGMLHVTRAVLPLMRRWGGGRIVNMGSLAGKEGLAYLAAYSAASAGVIGFTKALSREVVGSNILVNCVAPGPIDTDMIRGLGVDGVTAMVEDSPMKRLGNPDEVAHLVTWLCSEASHFNTGAVFDMSGGRARY